jgi:hypothetical protein
VVEIVDGDLSLLLWPVSMLDLWHDDARWLHVSFDRIVADTRSVAEPFAG